MRDLDYKKKKASKLNPTTLVERSITRQMIMTYKCVTRMKETGRNYYKTIPSSR